MAELGQGETGRTVLITGASAGIGEATASLLARNGFRVFGTSRRPSTEGRDSNFKMLQLDVVSDASVDRLVSGLVKQTGQVPDVLVNNAGIGIQGSLEETSLQEAMSLFETNFWGTVRMVNAVLPGMRKRKSGHIINLGSIGGVPSHAFPWLLVHVKGSHRGLFDGTLPRSEELRHQSDRR